MDSGRIKVYLADTLFSCTPDRDFFTYETESVFLAVLENSVLPMAWDS